MTHKILRVGYFWPSIFKDCIEAIKKCPSCQVFHSKRRSPPALLHPVNVVNMFAKWGIDFIQCKPTSTEGHIYIIIVIDYFTKWAEAMPTSTNNGKTIALFMFNHIITRFGDPQSIIIDHGSHFWNHMMT